MMSNKMQYVSTFFLLASIAVFNGCSSVPPVVKIGLVGPFEGRHREIGYDVIYSARLAIREENSRARRDQTRVALAAIDDFGDPEMAIEVAESLAIDPDVVAVIGHWLPETTDAARPIYQQTSVPFIAVGSDPFGPYDPDSLPEDFRQRYEKVTPFDETAGPYAGAGYDAVVLVLAALEEAEERKLPLTRENIGAILQEIGRIGITGNVYQP